MNENKQILKYCPNFYKIINFNPIVEDEISLKIIKIYQEYIFKINIYDETEINTVKELDTAIAKYINDYSFRKELQTKIVNVKIAKDCKNILKVFIDTILDIFNKYEDVTTRIIYIARWI